MKSCAKFCLKIHFQNKIIKEKLCPGKTWNYSRKLYCRHLILRPCPQKDILTDLSMLIKGRVQRYYAPINVFPQRWRVTGFGPHFDLYQSLNRLPI